MCVTGVNFTALNSLQFDVLLLLLWPKAFVTDCVTVYEISQYRLQSLETYPISLSEESI